MSKAAEEAYIFESNGKLNGFLYLKDETELDNSVTPPLPMKRRLKIGTFKINSHGTILGQRFMNIILSRMITEDFDEVYVTLFPKQIGLISLFKKFGFTLYGYKNDKELVYLKNRQVSNNSYCDYPRINCTNHSKFLLAIWPKFHTQMFPNSRLSTEKDHVIEDLSFTNTVEKIYITNISNVIEMKANDLVVIYRTKDSSAKPAEYSSVATSVCTIIDVKNMSQFGSIESYLHYCGKGSIFSEAELREFYQKRRYPYVIKMLYNFSLPKRIIRKDLIEKIGIERDQYFGFLALSDTQFKKIIEKGAVNESFIID